MHVITSRGLKKLETSNGEIEVQSLSEDTLQQFACMPELLYPWCRECANFEIPSTCRDDIDRSHAGCSLEWGGVG